MQKISSVEFIVLELALNHTRAALGVLDRSDECPEIAAQLDLVANRLDEEVAKLKLTAARKRGRQLPRAQLRLAAG